MVSDKTPTPYDELPEPDKTIYRAGAYEEVIKDAWYLLTHPESYNFDVVEAAEHRLRRALETFGVLEPKGDDTQ